MKARQWLLGTVLVILALTMMAMLFGPTVSVGDEKRSPVVRGKAAQKQKPDKQPFICPNGTLKIHLVPSGSAESIARKLQELFGKSPTVRISAAGDNRVLVYATPEEQDAIAPHIPEARPRSIEVIMLVALEAPRTAELLQKLFARDHDGPTIVVEPERNALIVRGSKEQIDEVKAALKALVGQPTPASNVRIITVETGDNALLASELQRLLRQMGRNPVRVFIPLGNAEPEAKSVPAGKDGLDKKKPADKGLPPVTISGVGNKLIVASEDKEALALVKQLTALYTDGSPRRGVTIVRLKHANAVDAARTLNEVINGRSSPGTASQRPERARIVADRASNALLIEASPLDLLSIRNLLDKALDVPTDRAESVVRTYFLGPLHHAEPADVAKVVRDLYGAGGKSAVTIAVDKRTSTLILRCSEMVHEEVRRLVERLDVKTEKKE